MMDHAWGKDNTKEGTTSIGFKPLNLKEYSINTTDNILFIANLKGTEEKILEIKNELQFPKFIGLFEANINLNYTSCCDFKAAEKINPDIKLNENFCFFCKIDYKDRINKNKFPIRTVKNIFGMLNVYDVLHEEITPFFNLLHVFCFNDENIAVDFFKNIKEVTQIEIKYEVIESFDKLNTDAENGRIKIKKKLNRNECMKILNNIENIIEKTNFITKNENNIETRKNKEKMKEFFRYYKYFINLLHLNYEEAKKINKEEFDKNVNNLFETYKKYISEKYCSIYLHFFTHIYDLIQIYGTLIYFDLDPLELSHRLKRIFTFRKTTFGGRVTSKIDNKFGGLYNAKEIFFDQTLAFLLNNYRKFFILAKRAFEIYTSLYDRVFINYDKYFPENNKKEAFNEKYQKITQLITGNYLNLSIEKNNVSTINISEIKDLLNVKVDENLYLLNNVNRKRKFNLLKSSRVLSIPRKKELLTFHPLKNRISNKTISVIFNLFDEKVLNKKEFELEDFNLGTLSEEEQDSEEYEFNSTNINFDEMDIDNLNINDNSDMEDFMDNSLF
jgi:hypothetical protein